MSHTIVTLSFDIAATVQQNIAITDPAITEDGLLQGLKAGHIITTLWHAQGEEKPATCEILDLRKPAAHQCIGFVMSQEVNGDYHGYHCGDNDVR